MSIVIKPLEAALASNDHIYAVVGFWPHLPSSPVLIRLPDTWNCDQFQWGGCSVDGTIRSPATEVPGSRIQNRRTRSQQCGLRRVTRYGWVLVSDF